MPRSPYSCTSSGIKKHEVPAVCVIKRRQSLLLRSIQVNSCILGERNGRQKWKTERHSEPLGRMVVNHWWFGLLFLEPGSPQALVKIAGIKNPTFQDITERPPLLLMWMPQIPSKYVSNRKEKQFHASYDKSMLPRSIQRLNQFVCWLQWWFHINPTNIQPLFLGKKKKKKKQTRISDAIHGWT